MRRRRVGAVAVGAVVVGVGIATWRLFVAPCAPVSLDEPVDAVVVFAGGRGERLARAMELVNAGAAGLLVIMNGRDPRWTAARALCDDAEQPVRVLCPDPDPDTTKGEARALGALVREEGLRRVAVVTSTYHVARVRLWTQRCVDADVTIVDAGVRDRPLRHLRRVVHEWGGMSEAALLDRPR